MIRSRALGYVAVSLLLAGCTDASLGDLLRDGAAAPVDVSAPGDDAAVADASAPPGPDVVSPASDVVTPPPMDVVVAPVDVVTPSVDVVTPRPDVVTPAPDVVTPRPDVVTPRPDVVTQPDIPLVCETCSGFAPVAFCRGTGSGACLTYAGCRDGCSACIPAMTGGDTCANAPVISAPGRSRTVLTTCGAQDNLRVPCNRSGPDIAFLLRVPRAGMVRLTLTVPEGVGLVFGYDPPGQCRTESAVRQCNDSTPRRTQDFAGPLTAGDWPIYVVTTVPSTVVVETELP